MAEKIKNVFSSSQLCAAVLHWDGKLLKADVQTEKVDRLAIIISEGDTEKILKIPGLEDGCGSTQATAIFEVDIIFNIKVLQFNFLQNSIIFLMSCRFYMIGD